MHRPSRSILGVLLLTSIAAGLVGLSVWPSVGAKSAAAESSIPATRAFYSAIDRYLQTGDRVDIDAATADRFELANLAGSAGGPIELREGLDGVRACFDDLRITITVRSVSGSQVTVNVHWRGVPRASFSGMQLLNAVPSEWTSIESVNVQGGHVTKLRANQAAVSWYRPLAEAALDMRLVADKQWQLRRAVRLEQVEIAPDPKAYRLLPGPSMMVLQTGSLIIRGNGVVQLAASINEPLATVPLDTDITATRGAVIVVPEGRAVVQNRGTVPVVLLSSTTARTSPTGTPAHTPGDGREWSGESTESAPMNEVVVHDDVSTTPIAYGSPVAATQRSATGVSRVELGQLTLDPDQEVEVIEPGQLTLLVVTSGRLVSMVSSGEPTTGPTFALGGAETLRLRVSGAQPATILFLRVAI